MNLRVVSPYRPFAPESVEHQTLGPFDWLGALEMLHASVARHTPDAEAVAITDVDTALPVPMLGFLTSERRLMLWILEVSLRYLESSAFDRDTVLISPDCLVLGDLRAVVPDADLGIVVRTESKHRGTGRVILNQVQFWRRAAQPALVAFYQQALRLARALPEDVIRWGADTEPLRQLLEPIEAGMAARQGLTVALMPWHEVLEPLTRENIDRLERGETMRVSKPVLDFRYTRKHHMRAAFESLFGVPA